MVLPTETDKSKTAGAKEDVAPHPNGGGGGSGTGGKGRTGGDRALYSRVYKPVGQLVQAMRFKPGVADDEYTEIREGPIKEGDTIVIEATGGAMNAPGAGPQNQTRGRGPRMF